MKDTINFGSGQSVIIMNESIGGVLLDLKTLEADGVTVADIADLSEIPLSIEVQREGSKDTLVIVNDYLEFILRALSAGTTKYDISITKRPEGYFIYIPFDGAVHLKAKDKLIVKCKAPASAFTDLDSSKSEITIETIPAPKNTPPIITCVETISYGSGADFFDQSLGNQVIKVALVHDLGADYLVSTEAKPLDGITLMASGFEKDASENALINENIEMHRLNPETPIQDLVLYASHKPLVNAKLKVKYNKAVLASSKVVLLKRKIA